MAELKTKIYEKNVPHNWVNTQYVQEKSLHFLFGYTIYKKKFKQSIPIECYSVVFSVSTFGLLLLCLTHPLQGELLFDTLHYLLHMVVLNSCAIAILIHRWNILELNTMLDKWIHYKELDEETLRVRKKVEAKASWYMGLYVNMMLVCNLLFTVAPVLKLYFSTDRSNMLNFLVFPCYLGFPIDTTWGFMLTYAFEVLCSTFAFTLYARLASYGFIISIHVNYQMKLLGIALETLLTRSEKITNRLGLTTKSLHWENQYHKTLVEEVNMTAAHLQYLHGLSNRIVQILTITTTSTYTGGMWIVCFSGLLIYTMGKESLLLIKFFMIFTAELVSVYLYSKTSEYLITSFEDTIKSIYFSQWYNMPKACTKTLLNMMTLLMRVPSLRTVIGYKANMENMGAILNASYSYFSLIMATKP